MSMKIETLTEKITEDGFSAILDYTSDTISVDIGDGGDMLAIPFSTVSGLSDFLETIEERMAGR